jgi:6-phospho-3-hexuloisomerase
MDTQKLILDRLSAILSVTDKSQAQKLKDLIDDAGRIFVGGAGRSGLVSRFFAMRLVHSG